jgi:hypothetical protein
MIAGNGKRRSAAGTWYQRSTGCYPQGRPWQRSREPHHDRCCEYPTPGKRNGSVPLGHLPRSRSASARYLDFHARGRDSPTSVILSGLTILLTGFRFAKEGVEIIGETREAGESAQQP